MTYQDIKLPKISKEEFLSIENKNITMSSGTIGVLAFDRYLLDNGWIVSKNALRNVYHPFSKFYNEKSNELLSINFGLSSHYKNTIVKRDFYILINDICYEVPQTEEDFVLFENRKLKLIF